MAVQAGTEGVWARAKAEGGRSLDATSSDRRPHEVSLRCAPSSRHPRA